MKKIVVTGALLLGMQYGYAKVDMEQMMNSYQSGNYGTALKLAKENLQDDEKSHGKNSAESAIAHNILGMILNNLNEHHKAIDHYERAISIVNALEPKKRDTETLETAYTNLASLYSDSNDFTKALEYYKKVLEYREDENFINHDKAWMTALFIGKIYMSKDDYDNALSYFSKANKSSTTLSAKITVLDHYAQLGEAFKKYKVILLANQELLKIVKEFKQTPEIVEAIKEYKSNIARAKSNLNKGAK